MAIEVSDEKQSKNIQIVVIIFYILLFILLIAAVSYAFLFFYSKKLEKEKTEVENKLIKTSEELRLEKYLGDLESKAKDFKILLNQHRFNSNIFYYLEHSTLEGVTYSNFSLDVEKNSLTLLGLANDLEILDKQLQFLTKQDFVKGLNLKKIAINKDKKVEFEIQLTLDSSNFKSFIGDQKQQ